MPIYIYLIYKVMCKSKPANFKKDDIFISFKRKYVPKSVNRPIYIYLIYDGIDLCHVYISMQL